MRRHPGADLFDAFSPAYRGPGQGVVGRSARFGLPDDAAQCICPDGKIVLNSKSIARKKEPAIIAAGQRCAASANHCSRHACLILITLWGAVDRQVSVTKQIFTANQIVETPFAHLLEKSLAGSLPRKLPIVDLDHN